MQVIYNQGRSQKFAKGGGGQNSPPLPSPPLPLPSSPLPSLPLEVGPLNPARGSGGAL